VNKLQSRGELEALVKNISESLKQDQPCITVCNGTGCHAYNAEKVVNALKSEVDRQGLKEKVLIKVTGCHGFCEIGPIVVVHPGKIFYQRVKEEDIPEVVSQTILNNKVIERLLYVDPISRDKFTHEDEVPFYNRQQRLIFGNNGQIDPTNIDDYLAIGGYMALAKALFEMSPQQVIDEIKQAGLRGRGGGGFPTGIKWESCRKAKGDTRYVICNCDEGDPGAYMDRSLMEGNPHSVLEGMIIGAYAIGSNKGYVYVRNEYPLAVEHVTTAIRQAEEYGLLGKNILGSGFDFNITVTRGGGAFVCGESTALMASLEGKVGEPRAKYVHTVEKGLYNQPTNLNNVETWANVPPIILKSAAWYNKIGTEGSKGTKIFSLVGNVNNTGLVEVPMGITLREIIYDIGGGIRGGKKFKAVQTGGPSGGYLPESMLDLPVDFDELTKAGSMMGSGGMIVMDENTCMVDVTKYFLNFLEEESCGKCLPCREGIKRMHQILNDITSGTGREGDIKLLEDLSATLIESSLCALGSTAPNPVLTSLRYFRDEYEAHIRDHRCPAGVCKELITYSIINDKCPGCGLCVKVCPQGAITPVAKKEPVILDQSLCIKCGACYDACNLGAIAIK